MIDEFPNSKQRFAVCMSYWDRRLKHRREQEKKDMKEDFGANMICSINSKDRNLIQQAMKFLKQVLGEEVFLKLDDENDCERYHEIGVVTFITGDGKEVSQLDLNSEQLYLIKSEKTEALNEDAHLPDEILYNGWYICPLVISAIVVGDEKYDGYTHYLLRRDYDDAWLSDIAMEKILKTLGFEQCDTVQKAKKVVDYINEKSQQK